MIVYPFDVVEHLIRVRHPDINGDRQAQSEFHGGIVAAVWAAEVLQVPRYKVLGWRVRGVKFFDADLIATRLGMHASALWPDWDAAEMDVPVWQQLRDEALEESWELRREAQRTAV